MANSKRIIDVTISVIAIIVTMPLWIIAAIGIKAQSPGPIFYPAKRAGVDGSIFTMHKFRTMHWQPQGAGPVITGQNDARIFKFGNFLRKAKIDELPQFIDVVTGHLSIVGPRPEDPRIVDLHYTPWMKETLRIKPGITSPGALWGYTKMDQYLVGADPESAYVEKVLPYKLALEYVYFKNHNTKYDLSLMWRTAVIVVQIILGKKDFADQPEARTIPSVLPYLKF